MGSDVPCKRGGSTHDLFREAGGPLWLCCGCLPRCPRVFSAAGVFPALLGVCRRLRFHYSPSILRSSLSLRAVFTPPPPKNI